MNNSRILLTTNNTGYLDIKPGASFPINFSLGDIRDISKRNGSFSKTITLVGNKNNNVLLGHLYEVNISDGTFNINTLQECLVEQDGIVILDNMYLQLTSIKKTQASGNHDYQIEYECEIKDSSADFFNKISNLKLTDLDFTEFNDHLYSVASVTNSFNHTWEDGYKYMLPYKQTTVSLQDADKKYILKEMRAGLYVRQYWDKIFSNSGYSYTFDEMDNTDIQFSKLIIPYNGDDIKTEDNIELQVVADNTSVLSKTIQVYNFANNDYTSAIPYGTNAPSGIIIDNEISDNQNQYNPTTGVFQPAFNITGNATMEFNFEIQYEIDIIAPEPITLTSVGPYPPPNAQGVNLVKPSFILRNNSSGAEQPQPFDEETITIGTSYGTGTTTIASKSINFLMEIGSVNQGTSITEKLGLEVENTAGVTATTQQAGQGSFTSYSTLAWINGSNPTRVYPEFKLRITNIVMTVNPKDLSLDYGVPVILNAFIPKKIKQSDFIKSLCQMYNLYIDVDPNNVTNLIIKTRDKFYDDGISLDWSKKLAKDKQQDLKFLPELSNKKILLTYKQDKDIANVGYFNNVNEIYGQVEYVFENEYVKGIDKKQLIFSPTPMIETNFGANVPYIDGISPKNNIRILLDNGLYDCDDYYITDINEVTVTNYPYIGHFDDPNNPTFDINFATCDFYYYNDYNITDNNLYNLHWRRTFGQINNGKLLKAHFDLTSVDIQKFSLAAKIRIDNSYWFVNKIIDYDANVNRLTLVELISVDEEFILPPFKTKVPTKPNGSTIGDVIGGGPNGGGPGGAGPGSDGPGSDGPGGGPYGPIKPNKNDNVGVGVWVDVKGTGNITDKNSFTEIGGNNNYVPSGTSTVKGNDNNLKSASFVYGDNNTVDYASKGNLIVGDNNTIGPGVEKSFVLGDNHVVTKSNTMYGDEFSAGDISLSQEGIVFTGGQYWDCGYTEEEYVGATCSKGTFMSFDETTNETYYEMNFDRVFVNGVEIPSGGSGSVGPTGPQGEIGATGAPGTYSIATTTTSITMTTDALLVDTSTGATTIDLPTSVGLSGQIRIIKDKTGNANTGNIILDAFGSETIDTDLTYKMKIRWESVTLLSDGANWWLL